MKPAKIINILSFILVALLGAGSFVLSFHSLWETAEAHGIIPRLSWIWPLLVDFALIVFSLAVVRASLYGERTRWPWFLVGTYTVATIAFNILHAPDNLAARIVAIVAPVSLFLSFETLMAMTKSEVRRKEATDTLSALEAKILSKRQEMRIFEETRRQEIEAEMERRRQELEEGLRQTVNQAEEERLKVEVETGRLANEVETKRQELDSLDRQIEQARVDSQSALETITQGHQQVIAGLEEQVETLRQTVKSYEDDIEAKRVELASMDNGGGKVYVYRVDNLTIPERQELVKKMVDDGLTYAQIAGALGVSESTVKNDKRAAEKVAQVVVNGNGRH